MPDLDIEQAAADIASDFGSQEPPVEESVEEPVVEEQQDVAPQQQIEEDMPPPQSWAKEKHDLWKKLDRDAKEYYNIREKQMLDGLEQYKQYAGYGRNLNEAFRPYQEVLKQQGIDEVKAVQYLLSAHTKLSDQDINKRTAYFKELATLYNVDLGQNSGSSQQSPEFNPLLQKVSGLESALRTIQQREYQATHKRVMDEVNAFAADSAHPYFDEVSDEIVKMLNVGYELKDAYERAVWANPVTRQKEIARVQTEQQQQLAEKRKTEAQVAKKAVSGNVRSRDTGKAPTEPLGSMEDTMRSILAQRRATH